MDKSPCWKRTQLFEPFLRPGESIHERGHRMELAIKVCSLCPLSARQRCNELSLRGDLTRGIWGGTMKHKGAQNGI